jgi:hypothetical protein
MFRLTYETAIIRQYDTNGKLYKCYTLSVLVLCCYLKLCILKTTYKIYAEPKIDGYKINVYNSSKLKREDL